MSTATTIDRPDLTALRHQTMRRTATTARSEPPDSVDTWSAESGDTNQPAFLVRPLRPRHSATRLLDTPTGIVSIDSLPPADLPPPAAAPLNVDRSGLDDDPELLCANLAMCVVEILAGARSLDQLVSRF